MPRIKRRDKAKKQKQRPTEIAALANIQQEAAKFGMSLRVLLRYIREDVKQRKPNTNLIRIARISLKHDGPHHPPLHATDYGRLG